MLPPRQRLWSFFFLVMAPYIDGKVRLVTVALQLFCVGLCLSLVSTRYDFFTNKLPPFFAVKEEGVRANIQSLCSALFFSCIDAILSTELSCVCGLLGTCFNLHFPRLALLDRKTRGGGGTE